MVNEDGDEKPTEEQLLVWRIKRNGAFLADSLFMSAFVSVLGLSSITGSVLLTAHSTELAEADWTRSVLAMFAAFAGVFGTTAILAVGYVLRSLWTEDPSVRGLFDDRKKLAALRKGRAASSPRGE